MRRRLLIALTAVGSVIVSLGAVGVFAAISDSALSGDNRVTTVAQPPAIDILVAPRKQAADGTGTCGQFTDNLTSGLFMLSAEDFDPPPSAGFCIKNNGSSWMEVNSTALDITDTDVECTGDEKVFDDTCGPGPEGQPRPGELAESLLLTYYTGACEDDLDDQIGVPHTLLSEVNAPLNLGLVQPGAVACFEIVLSLDPTKEVQVVQTDEVTWRFRWDATLWSGSTP